MKGNSVYKKRALAVNILLPFLTLYQKNKTPPGMASNKAEAPTAWTVIGVAGATLSQGLKTIGVLFVLRVRRPRMTIRFLQPTDLSLSQILHYAELSVSERSSKKPQVHWLTYNSWWERQNSQSKKSTCTEPIFHHLHTNSESSLSHSVHYGYNRCFWSFQRLAFSFSYAPKLRWFCSTSYISRFALNL